MSKEQIEEMACKNCIHYQKCVDTFRKAKQDGEILLIEDDAYFADANGCDFYADKRIYRKQSEGEWIFEHEYYGKMLCSNCNGEALVNECSEYIDSDFCPNCGAKMKGGAE